MLRIRFPGITQDAFTDAFAVLEECKMPPALNFPYPFFGPGGQYGGCWWERDSALALLGYRFRDRAFCERSLENFLHVQRDNGRIPLYGYDRVLDFDLELSAIPILFEVALTLCRETRDDAYVARIYGMLTRYMDWWLSPIKRDERTGLVCGIFEESDPSDHHDQHTAAQVDLNVQIALGADVLAELATRLGLAPDAARYHALFDELRDAINTHLYDPVSGGYYTLLIEEGRLMTHRVYNSMFDTFKRGIVPADRHDRLLALLRDDALFGYDQPWGITTMAKTAPEYTETTGVYQGAPSWEGNIWTLRNYIVARGLHESGLLADAAHIALQTVRTFNDNYYEFVSPSTGQGHGEARYAWSASQYIALIVEELFGISYDAVTDTVTVAPNLPAELWGETVSLENLPLGDGRYLQVTVVCAETPVTTWSLTATELN